MACVDFSEAGPQVLKRGQQLATQFNAELILFHAVEYIPPMEFSGDPMALPNWVMDESELIGNAKHSLNSMATQYNCGGCEQIITSGIPRLEIIKTLDERSIDLLVIGSHGRHGLGRLLGSTAHSLVNHSNCDLFLVRINS